MELVLILGIVSHFATPEKVRRYAAIGAVLVVLGTAIEIFAVWAVVEIGQQSSID
jgi:hypothetical protein